MNRIVLSLGTAILLFQFPIALLAQQHPDFSGSWVMDAKRSESYAKTGSVTLVIEQTPQVITIEDRSAAENLIRRYQLNDTEIVHEGGVRSRARIIRERLVISTYYPVRTLMGEWWVTSTITRSLAAGSNEMITETSVSIDHGYTFSGSSTPSKSRDVFVKQVAMDEYLEN